MDRESKIFVAGHRGLVGSAICRRLRAGGYDNLLVRPRSELDLLDGKAVAEFFEAERPTHVFVAAAKVGGIVANNTQRADFLYENLLIQCHLLHQAWRSGVERLLFLGSTCIYPREAPQPLHEESLLTAPLEYTNEPYAVAKIAGMKLAESYNLQYGTDFISVMPTNLYGPEDNFHLENSHVLPALLRKMHLGRCLQLGDWGALRADLRLNPLRDLASDAPESAIRERLAHHGVEEVEPGRVQVSIWGTGRALREFLWVEDLADACVFLMERVSFSKLVSLREGERDVRNTHVNIGTGVEITIGDLAREVAATVGFDGELVFDGSKPDGTPRKVTDTSRLRSLGWSPRVSLREGLGTMYAWYREASSRHVVPTDGVRCL